MTGARRLACLVAVVATGAGCRPGATERPPGPVASALFALAASFGADADATTAAFAELDGIAARLRKRHGQGRADVTPDLRAVVFDELGFEREVDSAATRFFTLSSVIETRRGSCLGLGALALAVAERADIALDGVLVPGHFFVRTRGASPTNVELLRRGEAMPESWYRQKYGPWPEGRAYGRPVTVTELVAIHWYNRGQDLRAAGDLAAAEQAYRRAADGFPDFAEAQASLGALLQRRGAWSDAEAAYRAAAAAWPELPGLARNLDLLRAQEAPP